MQQKNDRVHVEDSAEKMLAAKNNLLKNKRMLNVKMLAKRVMYASQLWCNFGKSCMQTLCLAYNFGCRAPYNLPWRASVSNHQVQYNIPTFEALLRKYKYLFLERCRKSNNVWLRALMQSDCLYLSLLCEHYDRILLCD